MEDDSETAFGVRPCDRSLTIADHVAGTAFEAVLVVEQDAAITRRNEKVRWTCHNALASRAPSARITVDGDVCTLMDAELGCADSFIERDRRPSCISIDNWCWGLLVESGHQPNPLMPIQPSRKRCRSLMPARFRSSRTIRRRPGFAWGLST